MLLRIPLPKSPNSPAQMQDRTYAYQTPSGYQGHVASRGPAALEVENGDDGYLCDVRIVDL